MLGFTGICCAYWGLQILGNEVYHGKGPDFQSLFRWDHWVILDPWTGHGHKEKQQQKNTLRTRVERVSTCSLVRDNRKAGI